VAEESYNHHHRLEVLVVDLDDTRKIGRLVINERKYKP